MTDRSERLAERSEQAADIALGSAAVAQKAAKKVVDALPRPDVRDDPNFARLAGQEQTWLAKLSPRRNFWPAVAAVDARIADLDRRQGELHDRLADLRRRRAEAGSDYASRLAAWMAGDQEGQKPLPEAATLDEAISEAAAEHAAIDRLREDVLADKIALVERRRRSLVRDAERAVGQAKRRYLAAVDAVEAAREELVDLNQTRIWAAVYPSDTLQTYPPDHVMVAGRRVETQQHGFQSAVPATSIFGLLRDDATIFASISTRPQAAVMAGVSEAALSDTSAMWADSDEAEAWRRRERERLIAAGGSTTVDALALLEAQRHGLPPIGSS